MITKDGKCTDPDFLFFMSVYVDGLGNIDGVDDPRVNKTIGGILTYSGLSSTSRIAVFFGNKPPVILNSIGTYRAIRQEKKDIATAIKKNEIEQD
jgi:hypothetical protein